MSDFRKMRPTEMLRLLIPDDDPIRIEFEAASQRIWNGAGVYRNPFCPDCTIVSVRWETRQPHSTVSHHIEQDERCEKHRFAYRENDPTDKMKQQWASQQKVPI